MTNKLEGPQETCSYVKTDQGFAWFNQDELYKTCIMATALKKEIFLEDLQNLRTNGDLTLEEYDAIISFDKQYGTKNDLSVIRKIAKRYKIKLDLLTSRGNG